MRECGWRQEPGRFVQFCACRKATKVIWRIVGTLRNHERAANRASGCKRLTALDRATPLASLRKLTPKRGLDVQPMGSNVSLERPTCRESECFASVLLVGSSGCSGGYGIAMPASRNRLMMA